MSTINNIIVVSVHCLDYSVLFAYIPVGYTREVKTSLISILKCQSVGYARGRVYIIDLWFLCSLKKHGYPDFDDSYSINAHMLNVSYQNFKRKCAANRTVNMRQQSFNISCLLYRVATLPYFEKEDYNVISFWNDDAIITG